MTHVTSVADHRYRQDDFKHNQHDNSGIDITPVVGQRNDHSITKQNQPSGNGVHVDAAYVPPVVEKASDNDVNIQKHTPVDTVKLDKVDITVVIENVQNESVDVRTENIIKDMSKRGSHATVIHIDPGRHSGRSSPRPDALEGPKDVMISYSRKNRDMMMKIKDQLEENGVRVWVDISDLRAGDNFASKIGEAVIEARVFMPLLSSDSITSRFCQDELALAYISDKPIFPVALKSRYELVKEMDTGMKLQLARFQWTLAYDDKFDKNIVLLTEAVKEELLRIGIDDVFDYGEESGDIPRGFINRSRFHEDEEGLSTTVSVSPDEYWRRRLGDKTKVQWKDFVEDYTQDFKAEFDEEYSSQDKNNLFNMLSREMEVDSDGMLQKKQYLEFCTVDGKLRPFWLRIKDQARESFAMAQVFNMKSTVRVEAIENLAKYKTPTVITALHDLLDDPDSNTVAVAAISLAKTGVDDKTTIRKLKRCLFNSDRLVRESGCLALGHLKAQSAIENLIHLWRNDYIFDVRQAAEAALNLIGGQEVEEAMRVTKILSEEIKKLKAPETKK